MNKAFQANPPTLPANKESLFLGIVVLCTTILLVTGLYQQATGVWPSLHQQYSDILHDLQEANTHTDNEILANALEISANYDRLTHFAFQARATAELLSQIPDFIPEPNRQRLVLQADQLQHALAQKHLWIEDFKRNNALLRNSLNYFPLLADDISDRRNLSHNQQDAAENFTRQVLFYARAPSEKRLLKIQQKRQQLEALSAESTGHEFDNLLLHGDIILKHLPRSEDIVQQVLASDIDRRLADILQLYNQGYQEAAAMQETFRKWLYIVALLLASYLVLTFKRLHQARSSLELANRELNQRYQAHLATETQLRLHATAFQNAHDGIVLADASGNIVDVNPAFSRLSGYSRSECLGQNPQFFNAGEQDASFYADIWKNIQKHGSWQGQIWNRNKQGEVYPELLSISAVRNEYGELTNYVAVFADLSLLKEHDRLLNDAVQLSEDAILLLDCENHQFIECNHAAVKMLRAESKDDVLFSHPWDLSPERQPDGSLSNDLTLEMTAKAEREKFHRFEWSHRRYDGTLFPAEVTLTPVRLADRQMLHVVWRDLSDIKRAQQSLERHTRALTMLSAGNQALVRSKDEKTLLQTMCEVAVKVGGFSMVWVGYRLDDAAQTVQPIAYAGSDAGYLRRATFSWGDNLYGQGPAGMALKTGKTQIVKNTLSDPAFAPWRNAAKACGYKSCVGLPLILEDQAIGVLMIYSAQTDTFDDAERPLLEEMAGDLSYGISVLRNENLRRQQEAKLDQSYSLLQAALEATADGLLVTSLNGEIERYNRCFAHMFALPPALLQLGKCQPLQEYLADKTDDAAEFIKDQKRIEQMPDATHRDIFGLADGRTIERITRPQYLNSDIVGRVSSYRDITEQKRYESQLTFLANHDALTGLPNRNLLNDRLEQAIAQAHRTDLPAALLFFDIDRFKLINDSLGHDNGDLFLKQLALRLPPCIREGDTVARMGGDEFVILLTNLQHEENAARVAHKLLEIISTPYHISGRELFATASVGITLYPRDGENSSALLKNADAAMYLAKERGGNTFQFFTGEINEHVARRFEIASQLRLALERHEFQVWYQPQLDVAGGRIIGAEALIRWQHPELGMVSPAEFIPIAEETGLIHDIGAWVVKTVCNQQTAWQAAGQPAIKVAINLSARQFESPDLPETFAAWLAETGASPDWLEIEITEGMVMKYPDRAVQMLNDLKAMGLSIAIDDFGTGYSSLGYLKRFPIDKLKIDRSFIKDIPEDKEDAAITRAVIAMAQELRLKVVAEGVETPAQLAFLKEHACDMVQGYIFGRPMAGDAFSAWLQTHGKQAET